MKKISLLLVDDHPVVRQGLRAFLNQENDIEVVGEAENGRQAVQMAKQTVPDIVIMDVMMPLLNGWEGTRQVLKNVPSTKVLVLSSYSDDASVQRLMDVGASGYLIKQTAADNLLLAIREVQKGRLFFSPTIAQRLRGRCRQLTSREMDALPSTPRKVRVSFFVQKLTSRETEVLRLIARGLRNKQVAAQLGISAKTVEKHRQQVMNKLNIHDVAGLTRYAISQALTEMDLPVAV
jgi:DNA-binding NarL/FixJ family response regulator